MLPLKFKKGKAVQGSLWCSACKGKCKYTYINYKFQTVTVICPICRGTGLGTFKGKVNK